MNKYRLLMAILLAAGLALAGCGGGSPQGMTPEQRAELADMALQAAKTAVDKVTDDSEEATVTAADTAMAAAEEVVGAASDAENHAALTQRFGRLQGDLAGKKVARTSAMQRADAAAAAAAEAAEAEADRLMEEAVNRLYGNIQKGNAVNYTASSLAVGRPTYDLNVAVLQGENHILKEDKDATVAAIKGWQGVKFSTVVSGDTHEAYAYTDIDESTVRTLGDIYTTDYNKATGVLAKGSLETNPHLISPAGFDLTVGVRTYTPASGETEVRIKGFFHGVPGTYQCTPTGASGENQCAARVPERVGVIVGGVLSTGATFDNSRADWTFKADDPGVKVTADAAHSTYGWWIAKFRGNTQWNAGAFNDRRAGDSGHGLSSTGSIASSAVNGTATYKGGAAGLYAIKPHVLGGPTNNDAGHFVADARLEANFTTDEIKGTIDNFRTGNVGMSPETERNWSVELMLQDIQTDRTEDHIANDVNVTKWTIDGVAGLPSGEWSGGFDQTPNQNSPPSVITGQFYSTYHGAGKIAGGFGANFVTE